MTRTPDPTKRRRRPYPASPAAPQVRVNAPGRTAALCKLVRPQDKIEILDAASKQGVFGKAVSDKSWRASVACAEGFADVADARSDGESVMVRPCDASTIRPRRAAPRAPRLPPRAAHRPAPPCSQVHIETLYKVLQGDHEQEVRVATALKAAGVAGR